MKTIYEGKIRITTEEESEEFVAIISTETNRIISSKTNREYAAIGEVMNEFKKDIINKAKEIKWPKEKNFLEWKKYTVSAI